MKNRGQKLQSFNIRRFANGWCGSEGVIAGLKAVDDGAQKAVTFLVADHPNGGDRSYASVRVGLGRGSSGIQWRYAGGGGDPEGAGSYKLADKDLTQAVGNLCHHLGAEAGRAQALLNNGGVLVFRQEESDG